MDGTGFSCLSCAGEACEFQTGGNPPQCMERLVDEAIHDEVHARYREPENHRIMQAAALTSERCANLTRVQETMERVARAYDIEEYDVYVLSNAIFANAVENGEKIDTKLKFVPGSTVHFGRIVGINQLSREIVAGKVSVEEAYARLHEIVSIPYTHPIRLDLACAVGSACFSYLFGGTVFDAAAAFICGFVLQVFLNAIDSRTASKFIINLASSAVVAVCAVLLFTVGLGDSLDKIIIGSIIRLVPGVALTTSIRDFLNGDYLSGTIRIIDAFLVGGCIAIGVGAVVMTYISLTGGAPLL